MTTTFYRKPYTQETRRNQARNPRALGSSSVLSEWQTRWGWTQSWRPDDAWSPENLTYVHWACPSSQDSAGRGFDVYGNPEAAAPGTGGGWDLAIPVTSGVPITLSVDVATSKNLSMQVGMRIFNPTTSTWLTSVVLATAGAAATAWRRVTGTFTPTATGRAVFYVVAVTGVALTNTDWIDATKLMVGDSGAYIDGDSAEVTTPTRKMYRWLGARNASASAEFTPNPATDVLTPTMLLGPVRQDREGRSATYDYLYSTSAAATVATVGWGGPRKGEHSMLFNTGAAGRAALDFFSGRGSFVLVDDTNTWLNMSFVIDPQGCTLEQSDAIAPSGIEFRPKLTVAYREIRA